MRITLPAERTWKPGPGICIYCCRAETRSRRLTREHIVPEGLGGRLVLHDASCDECAHVINSGIENFTQNRMFAAARTRLALGSSKRRLTSLRVAKFAKPLDGLPSDFSEVDWDWEHLPVEDHPTVVSVPVFEPPGILVGRETDHTFQVSGLSSATFGGTTAHDQMNLEPFSPDIVLRLVAKIAHGAATAVLGLDAFEPLLPGIILGTDANIARLVGSTARRPLLSSTLLHEVRLLGRREFIVAQVRLFASLGLHPFLAVVGTKREKGRGVSFRR